MVSEPLDAFHGALRSTRARLNGGHLTLAEMREEAERLGDFTAEVPGAAYRATRAGGVMAEWVTIDEAQAGPVLLYLHGGGFCMCSVGSHRRLAAHLAAASGARALVVAYRLAPEHPYPAAVEDVVTAYRWLVETGLDATRIALVGDSAGGNLALAGLLAVRAEGLDLPACVVSLSPFLDLSVSGDSVIANAESDLVNTKAALRAIAAIYLAGQDPTAPLASPVFSDLRGLPPLYLQVGDQETLLDDARRLTDRARAAGVEVILDVLPGMQHVFQLTAGNAPEADKAIADIGGFLRHAFAT